MQDVVKERIHGGLVRALGTRRESFLFEEGNIGERVIYLQILVWISR